MPTQGEHQQQVAFARVHRRQIQTMNLDPFRTVLVSLASDRMLRVTRGGTTWIAADTEIRNEDYLVGLIGLSSVKKRLNFNEQEWSWLKGALHVDDVADPDALVPFAIDLREERRWVAFAPKGRINTATFARGFQALLTGALTRQGAYFVNWEVDPVASGVLLRQWVEDHPNVKELRITLRLDNPGIDIDEDRALMRSLNSPTEERVFKAERGQHLTVENELDSFETELHAADASIYMRAQEHGSAVKYRSEESPEIGWITDFGDDLRIGMDLVLEALRSFSNTHTLPTHTGDPSDEPSNNG